ncbi:MAG TPA: hypothetical protein VGP96_03830 [Candidatus Dormibacteraeota bacterium]|nr:hypothetical protein [Candidatus Dormibacteraeota bacterium]
MAPVTEGVGRCAHCGAACRRRDGAEVWHCSTEHLLLVRLGVPPIAVEPAGGASRRPSPPPQTSRYASLRASLAHEAVNQRRTAVLRSAARRMHLLRGHLEAGLDLLSGGRREERVVRAVLIHPEVLEALAEMLTTLGGQPTPSERRAAVAVTGAGAAGRALALVRDLEDALAAAGAGRRDAQAPARRAAVELLGYVDSELRRSGRRPEAA